MRKISIRAHKYFIDRRRLTSKNTKVRQEDGEMYMYLFGNLIVKTERECIWISSGGYKPTNTTRDRLSCFVDIRKYKGDFIIDESFKWDGNWLNITEYFDMKNQNLCRNR